MIKTTKIYIIIAILAVIAGIVWYANKPNTDTPVNTDNPDDNQEQVVDEDDDLLADEEVDTSDWKTYRNEEFGYKILYPENKVKIVLDDVFERGSEGNPSFRINSGGHFALGVWGNKNGLSANEWINQDETGAQYQVQEMQFNNMSAYSAINLSWVGTCHIEWVIIPKFKKFYTFGVEICGESEKNSIELFHEIVDSFEFIN